MHTAPATVLVIEKHPLMRAALVNAIADEPDLTIAAITAEAGETRRIMESLQPQIVLFAIGNPGKDDLEAMLELRKLFPKTSILALTTHEVPGQEQAALAHGASLALAKTALRVDLLQALRVTKTRMEHSVENLSNPQRRDMG